VGFTICTYTSLSWDLTLNLEKLPHQNKFYREIKERNLQENNRGRSLSMDGHTVSAADDQNEKHFH